MSLSKRIRAYGSGSLCVGQALGTPIELITPHEVYQRLVNTDKTRQKRYLALFEKELTDYTLEEI